MPLNSIVRSKNKEKPENNITRLQLSLTEKII